ncbi:hypothetical protein [Hyphomonas sp.]|uniref:hypothetical protein n=1 Tax=Hyphomonas sp. TaxID=87 RepID=UPI003527294F
MTSISGSDLPAVAPDWRAGSTQSGSLHISARDVALALVIVGVPLLLAHVFVLTMNFGFGHSYLFGLAEKFNLNDEMNIPTLVATLELLACGVMLAANARFRPGGRGQASGWWVLCAIFVFLGFDENASLHEMTSGPTANLLQADWVPEYAWMIPYGLALLIVAAVLLPWFLKIDRASQIRFVVAGTIFVAGALGIEILESANVSTADFEMTADGPALADVSLSLAVLTTVQECMEYIGAGYFLYALVLRLDGLTIGAATSRNS